MSRPCFLVVDREFAGGISTRKLVIETAKFNVITAYSAAEAIETLARFPRVSGIVVDTGIKDMPCQDLVATLKLSAPLVPVVVVNTPNASQCDGADHYLQSFDPGVILRLLQKIEPEQTAAIQQQNRALLDEG